MAPLYSEEVSIPCIDLAKIRKAVQEGEKQELLQQLKKTASEWGFFQLKGHGVDDHVLKRVNAWGYKFFNLPLETRMKACVSQSVGYMAHGKNPSQSSGLQLLIKPENPQCTVIDEVWLSKEDQPLFKEDMAKYCSSMADLGKEILQLLEEALFGDKKQGHFTNAFNTPNGHSVRYNHYRPCEDWISTYEDRAGVHTDPNTLSILHQDVTGLEVFKDGQGIICKADPDSLVINVGDCLQVLSNKVFPSILHRGLPDRYKSRISTVYFVSPSPFFKLVPAEELVDEQHPALEASNYVELAKAMAARTIENTLL